MRGQALVQLAQVGLQFDESKGTVPNPFAFYTTIVSNSFKRVINLERKAGSIRDELIIQAGGLPSFRRQAEDEVEMRRED